MGPGPDAGVPEVLDAAAVMARYGLRDRRSARRVMDAAGAFVIGGRLLVRAHDLTQHEERLRDEFSFAWRGHLPGHRAGCLHPRRKLAIEDRDALVAKPAQQPPEAYCPVAAHVVVRPRAAVVDVDVVQAAGRMADADLARAGVADLDRLDRQDLRSTCLRDAHGSVAHRGSPHGGMSLARRPTRRLRLSCQPPDRRASPR